METTAVQCTSTDCSYNNHGCSAIAITVAHEGKAATCGTFVKLETRRHATATASKVGACQLVECKHNDDMLCSAKAIEVTAGAACGSFQAA